jgi:transposase
VVRDADPCAVAVVGVAVSSTTSTAEPSAAVQRSPVEASCRRSRVRGRTFCRAVRADRLPGRAAPAAGTARAAGHDAIGPEILGRRSRWFREAAKARVILNAARRSKPQKKRHALAVRVRDRADDYMRFADDRQVPFDSNEAEQVIRMSKFRVKVSGCLRSMTGAETFCAIRSCLATAARHGIGWLDALTLAAARNPWIPGTT